MKKISINDILLHIFCILPFNYAVYDVTRRETFTNLSDVWAKEIDMHSTNQECIKMLVGNKVDKVNLMESKVIIAC